jgi:competence protein ComEC
MPMRILEEVADRSAKAPVGHLAVSGGWPVLVVGTALVIALAWWMRSGRSPPRAAVLGAAVALPLLVWASALGAGPPEGLTVRFLDVGQGDAALVTSPGGVTMLVDGGPDRDLVATELAAAGVRRLDVVVASHPHADHIVGLPTVLARYQVGVLLRPGCPDTSADGATLARAIRDEEVPVRTPWAGEVLHVGDLRIDVLSPDRCWSGTESDTNNDALVLRVSLGGDVVLFATEPEEPAQEQLLEAGWDLRADVLKVPHHGAATSIPEFFEAVSPAVAVVPVGENGYGHPVPSTLAAIRDTGASVWRTDLHGTVTVTFSGGRVEVRSSA